MGYSPWGRKESDRTEATWQRHTLTHVAGRVYEGRVVSCAQELAHSVPPNVFCVDFIVSYA